MVACVSILKCRVITSLFFFSFTVYLPTLPSSSGYDAPMGGIISEY
jgi:hypothetical protein